MSLNIYDPFICMTFSYDNCFLCGLKLDDMNRTDEHVFPKWLQQEFDLWDKKMILLNRTEIPYRQLTIPCCSDCNNNHLASLERKVKNAYIEGYLEFQNLDETTIFQWIGKIYYGIIFRELNLLFDRKDRDQGTIVTPEMLEIFQNLHAFIQSIRMPFKFENTPWSIFVFQTHRYYDERDFDYHDNFGMVFCIRLGHIAIIAILEDGGTQKEMFSDFFKEFQEVILHPIQYDELRAMAVYKNLLMRKVPKFMIITGGQNVLVLTMPLTGDIYEEWDQKEYAEILERFWHVYGFSFEDIYRNNLVFSMLKNEDDTVIVLDKNGNML